VDGRCGGDGSASRRRPTPDSNSSRFIKQGAYRCRKFSPCLWFDGEAEEAANFYVSLLPDSRIEKIQKNTVDSPAGKAGSVLVWSFTLAGQRSWR